MPECKFQPEPYEGEIGYEEARDIRAKHLVPGLLTYYKKPVYVHQGHMQWLYDTEGMVHWFSLRPDD